MSAISTAAGPRTTGALGRLWFRELDRYPGSRARYTNLAIAIAATVVLYYELYVYGAVSTSIISDLHMSFTYYVGVLVISNAIGAFASLFAGAADRFGRANLVAYGLAVTSALTLFVVPAMHTKLAFGIVYGIIGFVEGVILVATPALVRDFSPQLGRASAMGFWTLGPVVGSLIVSEVSSHTLSHLHNYRDQYYICGATGLVISLAALVMLRELSPGLRDQVMVSLDDAAYIESRALSGQVDPNLSKPWRQMLKLDIVGGAAGISLFLMLYYTAVAFFPIFFQTVQNFSQGEANSLLNYYWASNAISLVVVGVLSDRMRLRKPFMAIGAVGTLITVATLISRTPHTHTSFRTFAIICTGLGIYGGFTFAPWMAAFTENVEKRNPALAATGLAVWGWLLRAVVALSFLVLPHVITSVTPLVNDGARVQAVVAAHPDLVASLQAHPAEAALLSKFSATNPPTGDDLNTLLTTFGIDNLSQLQDPKTAADITFLQAHGAAVQKAQADAPDQWRNWFWICFAGEIAFLPLMLLMAGAWSRRKAQENIAAEEAAIHADFTGLIPQQNVRAALDETIDLTASATKPRTRRTNH